MDDDCSALISFFFLSMVLKTQTPPENRIKFTGYEISRIFFFSSNR